MVRELLLAVAVLTAVTACTSIGPRPSPAHPTAPANAGTPSTPGSPPTSGPAGISSEDAARIAPLAPASVTAVADAGNVRLAWPATGEDITYYQCLRRTAAKSRWEPLGQTTPGDLTYLDRPPGHDTYVYGVQAVNANHVASVITESTPIRVG